jgi:lipoprotein-anchoring transpeptidase ErfK/SrfK
MSHVFSRRSLTSAAVLAIALLAAACGTTSQRPVIAGPPPPTPDEALASYRSQIEAQDEQVDGFSTPEDQEAIRAHVADILDAKVLSEYQLVIFINKAGEGRTAQHAFLFQAGDGDLTYLDTWLVSTGREQQEKSPKGASKFTTTPQGTFMFDLSHFSRLHKSNAWEADMPWAMFLKTRNGGPTTGIALHAALDKYVHNLGQRASAGCIRLLPSNAEKLYKLLQTKYEGSVRTLTPSGIGARLGGSTVKGAKAMVIIEDLSDSNVVASSGPEAVDSWSKSSPASDEPASEPSTVVNRGTAAVPSNRPPGY